LRGVTIIFIAVTAADGLRRRVIIARRRKEMNDNAVTAPSVT
jgi:hypothetical protein